MRGACLWGWKMTVSMGRRVRVLVCALAAVVGLGCPDAAGVSVLKSRPALLGAKVAVAVARPGSLVPSVLGVTREYPKGRSVLAALAQPGVELVIAGGFGGRFSPPSPAGLLVVDGNVVSPVDRQGREVLLVILDGRLRFLPRDSAIPEGTSGAMQVGPWLVKGGSLVAPDGPERATRAFVGVRANGAAVVGVTLERVRLHDLGAYLVDSRDAGGQGCVNAVMLRGGGSEALATRDSDAVLSLGNARRRQASMLVFASPE